MDCPPRLLERIKYSGGVIRSSCCFYEQNYEDPWANPWQNHGDDCFCFNCPILRDDEDFEEWEGRLMTPVEILKGSNALCFWSQHMSLDWVYFEQLFDQALTYYRKSGN